MDGTLAALVLGASLLDMGLSHCPTGCLAARETAPRWSLSAGTVVFQGDRVSEEIYLRRDAGTVYGPFQPTLGASVTAEGSAWLGAGVLYTPEIPGSLYVQGHIMPGLYIDGDGPDLGGALQFRSGLEVGYETRAGLRIGLALDHRSNADIRRDNPGLETVQLRVSLPAF